MSIDHRQARQKQFGMGGGGQTLQGGSPSRGSDVMSKNVWEGGGKEKSASPPLLHVTCSPRRTFFKVEY